MNGRQFRDDVLSDNDALRSEADGLQQQMEV